MDWSSRNCIYCTEYWIVYTVQCTLTGNHELLYKENDTIYLKMHYHVIGMEHLPVFTILYRTLSNNLQHTKYAFIDVFLGQAWIQLTVAPWYTACLFVNITVIIIVLRVWMHSFGSRYRDNCCPGHLQYFEPQTKQTKFVNYWI